jgi:hypothetical protein
MYDLNEISNKVKNGIPVTVEEYIFLLQNSDAALWGFMIHNNPGNIHNTLRHKLGYSELGFNPDPIALSSQITMMVQKGDTKELDKVIKDFVLIEQGFDPLIINTVKQYLQ